jgi:protoporphyrinogen/coproporphyrinogen III oxidase
VTRTVVIGGGVAGMVAARELAMNGRHVVLLEARDYVGGALRSMPLAGVDVDVGAEAFAVTRPETAVLIEELGLTQRVVVPRRWDARLALPDGVFPMPHAMLGVPTDLQARDVVAILGEEEARRAKALDAAAVTSVDPGVTIGALVRDRMGDVVADRILGPVVAGVHAADPDLVECEAVVPGLIAALQRTGSLAAAGANLRERSGVPGSAVAGLEGGMTVLARSLEDDLAVRGVEIRRDSPARRLSRVGAGWMVEAEGSTIESAEVVLAVSAPEAASLVGDLPDLHAALCSVSVGDVLVVAMAVEAESLDADPVGSGLLVAPGVGQVLAKALTHTTAKWEWVRQAYGPGHHLVRVSYGRNGRVEVAEEGAKQQARSDVSALLSVPQEAIREILPTRWRRSLVLPLAGHRRRMDEIVAAAGAIPGLAVVGAGIGGNGLAGTIAVARSVPDELQG